MKAFFLAPRTISGDSLPAPLSARLANMALLLVLLAVLFGVAFSRLDYHWQWQALAEYAPRLWGGWLLTIGISIGSLVLSMVLGTLVALGQRSRLLLLRYACKLYIELIRGTPLLVQIIILWYVIFDALLIPNGYRVVAGIVVLSIFAGAYIAEILRAGIESVGKSQIESAKAIGLTPAQTYRYVVFPQALKHALPPLTGQFANLIKDSSLLSVISVGEFTKATQNAIAMTYTSFEFYLPLALGYLILTLPISFWARWLEKRSGFDT